MDKTLRINLWASPRNISTALMYSFAQRSDTQVVDEPLYAHYLRHFKNRPKHPSEERILEEMENNGAKVIQQLLDYEEKPVLFIKNMTHHLIHLDQDFFQYFHHIILTRSPEEMICSLAKVIPKPSADQLSYAGHLAILKQLQAQELPYCVVEARRFLQQPKEQLQKICAAMQIDFEPKMLNWKAGPRPEDGLWATHWYKNVHQSTGFQAYQPKEATVPSHLLHLVEQVRPHYEELMTQML